MTFQSKYLEYMWKFWMLAEDRYLHNELKHLYLYASFIWRCWDEFKIFYYSRQIKMGGGSRDYIHVPVAEQKHMHVAH